VRPTMLHDWQRFKWSSSQLVEARGGSPLAIAVAMKIQGKRK